MNKYTVKLGTQSYPVITGSSTLKQLKNEIKRQNLYKNIFVVVDENVKKLHTGKILEAFDSGYNKVNYYLLKQGEKSKSTVELNNIYTKLLEKSYGRDTLIIGMGGGVTGDLAGYAASSYMRGVQLVHIPTTLLADVDSSVGGKTGINFKNKKNLIGTFFQPKLVLIDTDFLHTLPEEEFRSGIGEIIKYSFLTNKKFYNFVFKSIDKINPGNKTILNKIISESVQFKSSVVAFDEKENDLRKILNFGHTFAHAYESATNFRIKHGESVTAGIISALYLSNLSGLLQKKELDIFLGNLSGLKLPVIIKKVRLQKLLELMYHDKKAGEGKIKFVLLSEVGKIFTDYESSSEEILESIKLTFKYI
ncbi:MAG TPA: 3-dehydroquinate synthase [Ignavibacteriaceae bacterium]|nr:3-dehydroquinate synthase [Ignavibacteriaceae bacterium]